MKTKLVNKKVIFALVMSLALVLSYSSFAFAKDEAPAKKAADKPMVNAELQQELKETNIRLKADIAKAKKDLADVKNNKEVKDLEKKLEEAKTNKTKADKNLADAKKNNEAVKQNKEAVKEAEKDLAKAKADKAAAEKAKTDAGQDADKVKEAENKIKAAESNIDKYTKEKAALEEAGKKLPAEASQDVLDGLQALAKDADKAEKDAKDALDAKIAALEEPIRTNLNNLVLRQADVTEALNKITKGVKITDEEIKSILGDAKAASDKFNADRQSAVNPANPANAANAANAAKPQAKPATKGNGPQTADAQALAAYALGLVLVSAGAVYTFRKRNLNK